MQNSTFIAAWVKWSFKPLAEEGHVKVDVTWCPSTCSQNLNFLIRKKWEGHLFIYSKIFLVNVPVRRLHIEDTILNKSNALPVLTKLGDLWDLPKRRWEIAMWYIITTLSDNQYVRRSHVMAMQTRFYSLGNISWKKWSLTGGQRGDQKCYGLQLGGYGNRIVNVIHRREITCKGSVTVAGTNKAGGGVWVKGVQRMKLERWAGLWRGKSLVEFS